MGFCQTFEALHGSPRSHTGWDVCSLQGRFWTYIYIHRKHDTSTTVTIIVQYHLIEGNSINKKTKKRFLEVLEPSLAARPNSSFTTQLTTCRFPSPIPKTPAGLDPWNKYSSLRSAFKREWTRPLPKMHRAMHLVWGKGEVKEEKSWETWPTKSNDVNNDNQKVLSVTALFVLHGKWLVWISCWIGNSHFVWITSL